MTPHYMMQWAYSTHYTESQVKRYLGPQGHTRVESASQNHGTSLGCDGTETHLNKISAVEEAGVRDVSVASRRL